MARPGAFAFASTENPQLRRPVRESQAQAMEVGVARAEFRLRSGPAPGGSARFMLPRVVGVTARFRLPCCWCLPGSGLGKRRVASGVGIRQCLFERMIGMPANVRLKRARRVAAARINSELRGQPGTAILPRGPPQTPNCLCDEIIANAVTSAGCRRASQSRPAGLSNPCWHWRPKAPARSCNRECPDETEP